MADESGVAVETAQYPPADLSPGEFEQFVVELLESTTELVEGLKVTLHEKIHGTDGTYDFDATVRFDLGKMSFLVVVEAKRHTNPIKRELVQVLQDKLRSVGAQKAAMISTAPYQRGALEYAKTHGIALATVTEGRFALATKASDTSPPMTREEAARFGLPMFAAVAYGRGRDPSSMFIAPISTRNPTWVADALFGVRDDDAAD